MQTSRGAAPPEPHARDLAVLNEIAQALNASVDLDQSLGAALSRVAELLGLHTGWVWLLDEESGEPYLAAAQELPPGLAEHPERMEGSCYCLDTFRRGDVAGAGAVNVVTCSRLKWLPEGTSGLRCHASIPLYARGRRLGVMNLASPEWRRLSADDLRLLHTVGDLLGIAVERARLFASSTRAGAAEERNRLAREIHDTLAQRLAAVALQLETAEALLEAEPAQARVGRAVSRALALTRAGLEEARRSVLDLRAAPLEGRTLPEALAALAAAAADDGGPAVRLETVGAARPLPPGVEVALYRIAEEALGNVARHAGAGTARLRLQLLPESAALEVEDDGRGFDPGAVPADRFGLLGMRERARLLGGELRVESAPGAGTRVLARVPLVRPAPESPTHP
jgi:two-component system NarL family sensor kinase